MAKTASDYFKLDPWSVVEEGFEPGHNRVSESVFSLGNEYMGVRGYFEESTECDSLLGSYFNGVYEYAEQDTKTAYKGIIKRTHFMVTCVDWLYTRIELDGERLDMGSAQVSDFTRRLNLKDGSLTRSFIWHTRSGKALLFRFVRFVSMNRVNYGCQKITVTPIGFSGSINLKIGLDFSVVHQNSRKCHWKVLKKSSYHLGAAAVGQTLRTGQWLYSGYQLNSNRELDTTDLDSDLMVGHSFSLPLVDGEESYVEKHVSNLAVKDASVPLEQVWDRGMELSHKQTDGFEDLLSQNRMYWDDVWQNCDIQIEGDEKNQQGIRFCIFQLHQTYHGYDQLNNIGAKGLTGEAYNGHAFWDTETFCLPFFLFNNPKAAKNLLEFRYSTLQQAKARAKQLDCLGACYPIATLNGNEACDLWQHASLQFQPSTGIAYGIWHYVRVCGDTGFLYSHGAEMLVEISRFLKSRGAWNQTGEYFGFYAVMGPDEFHMMVDNNCYTNFMAKKTFEYTVEVVEEMRKNAPKAYAELLQKTQFTQEELDGFTLCAQKMRLPLCQETGVFEQHHGYFDLPHIDIDAIPASDFPLYYNWSYDRIYRTDMIKQPDVLMFLFLYNTQFSFEQKKANYEFYEPKTIHESSLSPSIHSIFAAELGKYDEAFQFFSFATRMDLDDYNCNTSEGLHTTSIAAAWVNIVYGFGGLRSDGQVLRLSPCIPAQWNSYNFRIYYKGAFVKVHVTGQMVTIHTTNNAEVTIEVYGQPTVITAQPVQIALKSENSEKIL